MIKIIVKQMKISEHKCQTNENSHKNDENTYIILSAIVNGL